MQRLSGLICYSSATRCRSRARVEEVERRFTMAGTADHTWSVQRLSGSLGAEIRGIRLREAGAADAERIGALLTEHLVLFFPEQGLTPDEHIAFGRLFGTLEAHPN